MSDSSAHNNNVTIVNRKLLLIDSRVQDTTTIINAANDDTYCLVFNYYQDTTDTLLSKIRFLNDNNRYIEDNFYYFEPKIKKCNGSIVLANLSEVNTDPDPAPSDSCVSCTEEEINNIQLVPSTLYAEHLSFTLNGPSTNIVTSNSSTNDISFNLTTAWPYYETKIHKPVFFQRSTIIPINTDASSNPDISGSNMNTDASSTADMPDSNANANIYPNRDISSFNVNTNPDISSSNVNIEMTPSKYKQRGSVFINHLDEIYELAKQAQEVSPDTVCIHFDVIGIIQHANATKLGYKLFDNQPLYAEIDNVSTSDSQLNSWVAFSAFIQVLKTKFNLTTLDLMACALYSNPDWKYIIDTLSVQQNIIIRASYDDTGVSSSGGNWILETNDINLTSVYFTPEIYNWKFLLTSSNQSYALQFDGDNDAINVGTPSWSYSTQIRQTFTVECWFKTSDTSIQKYYTVIVGRNYGGGTSSTAAFVIYMHQTGEIGFGITTDVNTSIYLNTTQTYKDAKWHHVAGTYNYSGGNMKLYIDGVNVITVNDPTKGILSSTTSTRFVIGSDDGGLPGNNFSNRQFRGYISDVRMWNVVRSDADISNNYQQRLIGNETGLVGYWKLNQGYGTGWGTYSLAVDSAVNRTNGELISFANPSASWVVSDISFNPRITNFVLGPKNGVYDATDSSFSFIDPSSNSLGAFSYSIDNSNATIADGASTTKIIYSNTGPITIPTLNTYEFPMLADLANWQIDISFTVTGGGGSWRPIIGDMYNDISPYNRGWGIWVSAYNSIHWSWLAVTYEASFSVNLNTAYILTVIGTNTGSVTLILTNAATSSVIGSSSTTLSNTQLGRGPVTIGGWRSTGPGGWGWNETFPGTISYVNVSVPTVNRVVTILSGPSSVITASQTHYFDFVSSTKTANLTRAVSITSTTITRASDAYFSGTISKTYAPGLTFSVAATSSRGTAVSYFSSDTSVATVDSSSGLVTVLKAGPTTITASQTETSQYTAGSASWALTVALGTNPWSNTFYIASPVAFGDTVTYTAPVATYSPAGAITYSTTTDVSNVATINETTGVITLVSNGTVTFRATQAATDKYASSTIDSSAVTVNRAITTITRASDAYVSGTISKIYASGLTFSVAATSSRGTAVSYFSSDTTVATVDSSSGLVTVLKAGPTTISASQTQTSQYAAGSASWALTVALMTNTLIRGTNFTNTTITRTYDPNSTTFNVSASSDINSITDVVFTSSDPNVASITRVNATTSQITINTAGSITITASQAQMTENQYAAATDISCALIINRRLASLFRNAPYATSATIAKYYGTGSFYLSASSSSDGAVTYESDNSGVAQVNSTSGEVNLYGVGTAAITVRQADSSKYTTPTNITWTLDISRGTTAITGIPTDLSYSVINAPFYLVPSTASGGTITYSLSDPSSNVATVNSSSGLVTLKKAGVATIVVSQAQSALYNAPSSVSCTLTVSGAGNSLENVVINSETQSFSGVDLSGASLAGATMTGVSFDGASLAGASLAGANVSGASFAGTSLVGASLAGANVSGASFDGASMAGASLAGANVAGASFAGTSLAGASLAGANISGASFSGASLSNADLSGADISGVNFSNANISGANISGLSFAPVQKLQLLKNTNNRQIDQVQIEDVTGDVVLSVVPQGSTLLQMPNIETAVFKVIVPNTSTSPTAPLINVPISQSNNADAFYLPISEGEYFKISNVKYYIVGTTIKNYRTNETVDVLIDNGKQYRMFVGSIAGVTLEANTLSSSTFIGPIARLISDTRPIYTTTRPTSNSGATIVYSSNNPSVATIDSSGEQITMISAGSVSFTASQVATLTHAGGSITSNTFTIYTTQIKISFNVAAFDSILQMDVSGTMPGATYQLPTTDATSVFYVKLDDFRDVFKFQTDSFDINDASMSDTRYYVFKNRWPSTIKLNPSHSMIDVTESTGMMGSTGMFAQNKALLKHDYIRYLAYKLFRTIHGVDLFKNESDLLENLTYWGETIRNDIESKLDAISTTSSDATMLIDNSGNRFLTNDLTTNTNISRELMTQIYGNSRDRLFDISGTSDIQSIPLMENDSFNIIITVFAAENQNNLTGADSISSRTYNMKVVLKNDITGLNVPVIDSEMYPNAYPYSGNVAVITADSSANYISYSPPVAVPVSRYGFNGWYYKNTSAWVTVDPTVRNKIKWSVSPNTGSTKVSDLQYLRVNVKVYNKTSLPYITVYTASSKRAYVVSNSADISNNGKYTFYANFNAYTRLPAVIDHTNQELTVSSSGALTQGSFDNNEIITRIAFETDSAASYDAVEFTMSCIVVGETSGEKEHWFRGVN
jgi:uncharacterized protein YjbI with pentapeptide repeats